jgi:hypothetical protein
VSGLEDDGHGEELEGEGCRGQGFDVVDKEEEDTEEAIPPPQTPLEPMEYLWRSWSVSALEISEILVSGSKKSSVPATSRLPEWTIPEDSALPAASIVPLPFHQQHVIHGTLHHSLF